MHHRDDRSGSPEHCLYRAGRHHAHDGLLWRRVRQDSGVRCTCRGRHPLYARLFRRPGLLGVSFQHRHRDVSEFDRHDASSQRRDPGARIPEIRSQPHGRGWLLHHELEGGLQHCRHEIRSVGKRRSPLAQPAGQEPAFLLQVRLWRMSLQRDQDRGRRHRREAFEPIEAGGFPRSFRSADSALPSGRPRVSQSLVALLRLGHPGRLPGR